MVRNSKAVMSLTPGNQDSVVAACPANSGGFVSTVVYGVGGRYIPTPSTGGVGQLSGVYPSDASGADPTGATAKYATASVVADTVTSGTLEVWAFCGNP